MKKKSAPVVWILFFLLFVVTGRIYSADVIGTVTDNTTGLPLQNVIVKILETGDSTQTDIDGNYFFPAVPNGPYTFLIGGGNYTPLILSRTVGSCCVGFRGNINNDPGDAIDISDLVYFVTYAFGTPPGPAPVCFEEADVDASGALDIADIVYMVTYMFATPPGPQPLPCL